MSLVYSHLHVDHDREQLLLRGLAGRSTPVCTVRMEVLWVAPDGSGVLMARDPLGKNAPRVAQAALPEAIASVARTSLDVGLRPVLSVDWEILSHLGPGEFAAVTHAPVAALRVVDAAYDLRVMA